MLALDPQIIFDQVVARWTGIQRNGGHIPRPVNAFFIFKSRVVPDLLPKAAGRLWHSLRAEERSQFYDLYEKLKRHHSNVIFPGYKYSP
ncbi:hypothetical protein C8J56DRAFT_823641, partial [Mycena floridula]